MSQPPLFQQVLAYANRANPYPLYAQLRETPVSGQEGIGVVVSTYREIATLLTDPRLSSDQAIFSRLTGSAAEPPPISRQPSFLVLDPPRHDVLRAMTTKHFGPPDSPGRVEAMRPRIAELVNERLDALRGETHFDVVDALAYPLPVTVICDLLGVPREDEPKFRVWSDVLVATLNPDPSIATPEFMQQAVEATRQIREYMATLIAAHRNDPGDDLLSAMVTDPEPMGEQDLISTAVLLLIAGHETTVNLITNGMLTLLRYPEAWQQLRQEPQIIAALVEELLRFEPPVQMLFRVSLADIPVDGAVIPDGVPVILLLAAGNRDPQRFADADRFDPLRADNQHLGFGRGIHLCFGAPLARVETEVALMEMTRRLENPRLLADPPPYRHSPVLRGPRHLAVGFDRILD